MNALELADEFQNRQNWKLINYIHWSEQSETMLRQLQAENEALKAQQKHPTNMEMCTQLTELAKHRLLSPAEVEELIKLKQGVGQ